MAFRLSLTALGLVGWLTASASAADDVEVLAKGPVHEAYAEPAEREPTATPVIPKEPPKLIEELPPDQKPEGDSVQWMPGYWAWDEDKKDFIWVSGFWRNAPPGRAWVPGSWRQAGDGWQWSGGFWAEAKPDGKAQVEYLPQPPAPLDVEGPATPAPSENHVYAPGTWVYRDRYVWRPGYWYEHQPGLVWISAHYRWTPAGYVFIDGYWDHPCEERGVLFAPVYVPPVLYSAPSFVYTPTYVVREDCLFGAFFCRRGFGSYYFGDYFAPSYVSLGFSAWCGNVGLSFSFGRGYFDPLFSYYRCGFRHDPFWGGGGVFDLYAGRYRGDYLRPPVNLIQQNTIINNITNVTNITNVNTNNVTMLTSLNNADRGGRRRLTRVPESERREFLNQAGATQQMALRRAQGEAQLAARPGAGGKTGRPTALTLDTPPAPKGASRPTTADPKLAGAPARPSPKGPARPLTAAPPPPKPSPHGKMTTKPTGSVPLPKGADGVGASGGPSRPGLKPPPAPKPSGAPKLNQPPAAKLGSGATNGNLPPAPKLGGAPPKVNLPPARPTTVPPKGSGINPVSPPKVGSPAPKINPGVPARPSPKFDLPPARPAAPPPSRPTAPPISRPAFKPPPSSPPVTVPKPSGGLPAVPRSSQLVPRSSVPRAPSLAPRPSGGIPRLGPPPSAPRVSPAPSRSAPRISPARSAPSRPAAPPRSSGKRGKR
jgi:hypothetical protein